MRQALASQRLRLNYQPQVDLGSGAITGAEALIRWRDPELGDVASAEFIRVAEETGFIVAIGDWVLAQAARQCARWRPTGIVVPLSVKVAAAQFQRPEFVDRVAQTLRDHALPGALLELELAGSILAGDADELQPALTRLAALGVRLAIDDFGSGGFGLAGLERHPVERLKIDRRIVAGVPGGRGAAAIVRATVELARGFGLEVVAEGVETPAQRDFLRAAGCDAFQGELAAPGLDPLSFVERWRGQGRVARAAIALVSG
jgi:EAL domain-containing protein (putative c-di-GMP-specific phosphodiesterase class I)